jgi:predicted MFS family arabinose efflux permease
MFMYAMCTAIFAMAVTQFTKAIDRKPFNCELCVTFWVSLAVAIGTYSYIIEVVSFVGFAVLTRQVLFRVWRTMF